MTPTSTDNKEVNEVKRRSLIKNKADAKEGHGQAYPQCSHDMPLGQGRKKYVIKWTPAWNDLNDVICRAQLIKSVREIASDDDTSSIAPYYKKVTQPKPQPAQEFFIDGRFPCFTGSHTERQKQRSQFQHEPHQHKWSQL